METPNIKIRKATQSDAAFVAWALSTAVGTCMADHETARLLTRLVLDDEMLYSWQSAFIATSDDKPVGAAIAYDGTFYAKRRAKTFQTLRDLAGLDFTSQDDETQSGELYIDTLAVMPAYRKQGIGRKLLLRAIAEARALGLTYAALAVHPDNLHAQTLYRSLGFVREQDIFIFGETYWKMRKPLK